MITICHHRHQKTLLSKFAKISQLALHRMRTLHLSPSSCCLRIIIIMISTYEYEEKQRHLLNNKAGRDLDAESKLYWQLADSIE